MYKIAIIEDEYLTCLGLEKAVAWSSIDVLVCGSASDGKNGLELIRREKPDIVLTDIRMPGLNGVDLVKTLAKDGFDGEIIVLSAYKEFDYAVETYQSGIFSYLLKPIDNAELLSVVSGAIEKLKSKREREEIKQKMLVSDSHLKERFITNLISGDVTEEYFAKEQEQLSLSIPASGLLFVLKEEEINDDYTLNKASDTLLNGLKETHILYNDELIAFISSIDESDAISVFQKRLSELEELTDSIFTCSICGYSNPLEISSSHKIAIDNINNKLCFGFNSLEVKRIDDISFRQYASIQQFYKLISEHYKEDITVSMISLMMNVSDSFLMHLLKKSLGRTFNDILTDYRMSLAKKLLKKGNYRINEVATLVGYNDEKYFSRVFKKKIGVNPSEYPL